MRSFSSPFLFRLFAGLCLVTLLGREATAQTAVSRGYDPSLADPQYDARKLRLVNANPAAYQVQTRTIGGGTGAPAALPACFEPLDSTATGGYTSIARGDDNSSAVIPLGFTFTLFGNAYNSVFINTNGNLTFTAPLSTFSASGFPISTPMIAAFWADVDTRPLSSGRVWYKLYPDRLVVTWNRVGYFNSATDKKNTFQIIIRANSATTFIDDVTFAYGDMQWTTGSASNGNNGFGGDLATVGANRGNSIDYIQTGRFNINDSSHPDNVSASGVNWLDEQCISYRVFSTGNLPPSVNNFPANSTITVNQGQTVSIAPQFSGPEAGQAITLAVNTNGLCNAPYTITGGINPTLNLSVTGAACNIGTSTITVTATDNGSPVATRQFPITVIVNPPALITGQWTGSVSTAYTDPANWSSNVLPTSAIDVTIPASAVRMPVVSAAASANSLTIASGASLTIASSGTLTLNGSLVNNGTFTGTGTLATGGSSRQGLGGNLITTGSLTIGTAGAQLTGPVSVSRVLTLNGSLATLTQALTLLSDATGTAMVVNNNAAVVVGDVTVQRYINPTLNAGAGYRHYAAPVSNTSLADLTTAGFAPTLNTVYNTAAVPGTVSPFPTVFGFDESRISSSAPGSFDQGWFSPANAGTAMTPGVGYTVNLGASSTVDFVGNLNNGNLTRTGLTRGTQAASGWHLLGNPYPAPIDWQAVVPGLNGLDNAVYVFKSSGQYAGSYSSFVNGVGDARFIPVAQAFFVRTTTAGTPGSLSLTNAARLTTYQNPDFNRTPTTDTRPLVQLDLVNGTQRDAATLYFEQGATTGFDRAYDAYKLSSGNVAGLAFVAGADRLAISGLPALTSADVVAPLRVWVPANGTYTLEANKLLNLPAGYFAYLQDAQTNTTVDLAQQPSYTFTMDAAFDGPRFTLLLSNNRILATSNSQLSQQVQLYPNPAHEAATLLLPVTLRKQAAAATLLNSLGQVVRTYSLHAAPGTERYTLPLTGLARGVYTLRLATPNGLAVKRLIVE